MNDSFYEKRVKTGRAAVNGSARFEWSAIAARYRDLYAALIKGQGREI